MFVHGITFVCSRSFALCFNTQLLSFPSPMIQNTKKQLTIMESFIQRDAIEIVTASQQLIQQSETKNKYLEFVKTLNSDSMLSIKEFVRATNYNIDPLIIDEQWNMLNTKSADEMITLTPQMIERLNFSKIGNLTKKLEQLFPVTSEEKREYWGDGVNVNIVLADQNGTKKGRGGHNSKVIKVTKGAYKELLMETQTDAARQVRKYYICLEELFVQYLLYQQALELVKAEKCMEIVISEKKQLMTKLDIVIEQNNGLARQLEIQDKKLDTLSQILYKESNNKVMDVKSTHKKQKLVVMQEKKDDSESCIVLRGLKAHLNMQMKRTQDQMHVVGTVESYRNPINLYNLFSEQTKKQKDARFDVTHNKVTLKNGTAPIELLGVFKSLNDQKFSVAECVKKAL